MSTQLIPKFPINFRLKDILKIDIVSKMHILYAGFNCTSTSSITGCMSSHPKSIPHFTSLSLVHNAWTRILGMGKTARCDYLNLFYYQGRANEQIRGPGSDLRLADYICYYCHYRAGFRIWPTWRWGRWDVSSILSSRLLSILLGAAAAIFRSVAYGCCHEGAAVRSIEHWIIYLGGGAS